ncbi:hypothetical protein OAO39_03405 [Pirellulaceae bacterium]|jgi:hypothetical protein|nr:hypothetical protein [Pirellulaceae bacterium]
MANPAKKPYEHDTLGESTSASDESSRRRPYLKVFGAIFALLMVLALALFWIYGTDTHHANRNSIWWPERGWNLTPPTATDITLRRDFLDHYAIYTISERDLNAFLDRRFARPGEALDSFSERSPANPESIGKVIGPLGWVVTEDTVEYSYSASNGGGHYFYHDTTTGLTYQDSAYW